MSIHQYIDKKWKNGKWVYTYVKNKEASSKNDHKYIKREWKNGKWIYTYPEDLKKEDNKLGIIDKIKDKFGLRNNKENRLSKNLLSKNIEKGKNFIISKASFMNKPINSLNKTQTQVVKGMEKVKEFLTKPVKNWKSNQKKKKEKEREQFEKWDKENIKSIKKQNERAWDLARKEHEETTDYYKKAKERKREKEDLFKKMTEETKKRANKERQESKKKTEDVHKAAMKKRAAEEKQEMEDRKKNVHSAVITRDFKENLSEHIKANSDLKNQIRNFRENGNPLPELNIKGNGTTADEDAEVINPNYDVMNPKTSKNCAYCTIAYDLRRRGYDVKAIEKESNTSMNDIEKMYKSKDKKKKVDARTSTDVVMKVKYEDESKPILSIKGSIPYLKQEMLKEGEGARGNLGINWINGGGHSVVWEVENGKVMIKDTQLNAEWELEKYAGWNNARWYSYLRTDNLIPTEEVMKYVKNVR